MDIKKLKSGSDIRGTAISFDGSSVLLNQENVRKITDAFYFYVNSKSKVKKIAVGCDSRLSSPDIKETVVNALKDGGAEVFDIGLCSTPSMFMMTKFTEVNADAAIMITASHHPKDKNGLKFFTKQGGMSPKDIDNILTLCSYGNKLQNAGGTVTKTDYFKLYTSHLVSLAESSLGKEPLKGLKIVVDAGNGAGGFYAKDVLEVLGADTSGSQFLEPDGNFPNHSPNPENSEAMRSISECVLKNNADLGVIFDTDVDRAAIVSSDGREINRNTLIALISAILLKENKGSTIVTDSVTSLPLKAFINNQGGEHYRFKRGYKNIIDEAVRLNEEGINVPLAIETSGHAALKENYFLDDGAYLVTRIIIEAAKLKKNGKNLMSLLDGYKEPLEQSEVRITFNTENWRELGSTVLDGFQNLKNKRLVLADDDREGVRQLCSDLEGFVMLRLSVHDPVIVINVESEKDGGVVQLYTLLYAYLKEFSDLNLIDLENKLK